MVQRGLRVRRRGRPSLDLENLGAKTKLSKRKARILENLRKNKPVATGTRKRSEQWARMMTEWEELTELEEVKHAPRVPTKVERLKHLAKRYEPYQKFAKGLTATLGTSGQRPGRSRTWWSTGAEWPVGCSRAGSRQRR